MSQAPQEITFDQTESITARLRDLVRSYPKGSGLLKEFLQNADDAGATTLTMIYDERQHPGSLSDPEMDAALGPAILFTNDAIFSQKDFEGIQRLGEGSKTEDSERTGRFGQGFNTCYSVTDNPLLLSGDRFAWFDPHRRIASKNKNAYAWRADALSGVWRPLGEAFAAGGFDPESDSHRGTIFRLPLRNPLQLTKSAISKEAFSSNDFEAILTELAKLGPALLVFLRSVLTLEIWQISSDGTETLRYAIQTTNSNHVGKNRALVRSVVTGKTREVLERILSSGEELPVASFNHKVSVVQPDGKTNQETWRVVTGLFRGPENVLLNSAISVSDRGDKAIPWGGAAIRIDPPPVSANAGGVACFLPVPETTQLPVWLHGWFDLSSDRRSITRNSNVGESAQARYKWNKDLMRHAIGPAWALLIKDSLEDVSIATSPYSLWPRVAATTDELQQNLVSGFYETAARFPVVRAVDSKSYRWAELRSGMYNLPDEWHPRLLPALVSQGWSLCDPPLPNFVQSGFRSIDILVPELTPKALRTWFLGQSGPDPACTLDTAPFPMLRKREWVCSLAEFCREDEYSNLNSLPLAILGDGLLHRFNACGPIHVVTKQERALLRKLPNRVLDIEYQDALAFANPEPGLNLSRLNLDVAVTYFKLIVESGAPDKAFLTDLFSYLSSQRSADIGRCEKQIKSLKVVPDQFGNFLPMGNIRTPLLVQETNDRLLEAMRLLGISLVRADNTLLEAIRHFSAKHDGYIWPLTPDVLGYTLKFHVETPRLNEFVLDDGKTLGILLDFLAKNPWLKEGDERTPLLRKLRILPTSSGERVAASDQKVYIPTGFTPPNGLSAGVRILNVGPEGRWRNLFSSFGVASLNGSRFVTDILIPAFPKASQDGLLGLLLWLRDEYRKIERSLSDEERKSLRQKLLFSRILPVRSGGLSAPFYVYRPDALTAIDLLGPIAPLPDEKFFHRQPDLWNTFFDYLALPHQPRAIHIYNAILACTSVAKASGASQAGPQLKKLIAHISERWTEISGVRVVGEQTLAEALSDLAWMPAVSARGSDIPGIKQWPDRLWKPRELMPLASAGLAASQCPLLDSATLPTEMAKDLGLCTEPVPATVFNHFRALRQLPVTSSKVSDGIHRAATRIYHFFGRHQLVQDPQAQANLASLGREASIFVKGSWRMPSRCFFEILPLNSSRLFSLGSSGFHLDPMARLGLERLGVRSTPDYDTWIGVLSDLASEKAGNVLTEDELHQVRQMIRLLRAADDELLAGRDIWVPALSGKLEISRSALIPDDPRLGRKALQTPLPIVEDSSDVVDVSRRAGARSLCGELFDRLVTRPSETSNPEAVHMATNLERSFKSSVFQDCLRRLIYHEALRSRAPDPRAAVALLDGKLAGNIRIKMTSALHVASYIRLSDNRTVPVFDSADEASYLEAERSILWVKERSQSGMLDEIVRSVCRYWGIADQLRLNRLLEISPEAMFLLLDEDGIAVLPGSRVIDLGRDESHDESLRLDGTHEAFWDEGSESDQDDAFEALSSLSTMGQGHLPSSHPSSEGRWAVSQNRDESSPSTLLGTVGDVSGPMIPNETVEGGTPPGPPNQPGRGTNKPWPSDSRAPGGPRLVSYAHPRPQNDYDGSSHSSAENEDQQLFVAAALAWENDQGRKANLVDDGSEYIREFDLESSGEQGNRYIAVVGVDGGWGSRGVPVSQRHFESALKYGKAWWLYVVEFDAKSTSTLVTAIQNPFLQSTEFRFDEGWRFAAEQPSENASPSNSPIQGQRYETSDGTTVRVIRATRRGHLWGLKVELPDGSTKSMSWDPSWRPAE